MELTEEQKNAVRQWVREGLNLADIQQRLKDQFSLSMTYMDLRFLVLELGVELKEKTRSFVTNDITKAQVPGPAAGTATPAPAAAGVTVEVDRVTKPGALVSGTVRFSDGVTAAWSLDQMGRLALAPSKPGYKPAEADVAAFQQELRSALERMGF